MSAHIAVAFDLDTVKLLMTLFDTDRSGTIGFTEVIILPYQSKEE
jgi:NADH:ubiquinone oxidoreductase subunit 3 (subunit A)